MAAAAEPRQPDPPASEGPRVDAAWSHLVHAPVCPGSPERLTPPWRRPGPPPGPCPSPGADRPPGPRPGAGAARVNPLRPLPPSASWCWLILSSRQARGARARDQADARAKQRANRSSSRGSTAPPSRFERAGSAQGLRLPGALHRGQAAECCRFAALGHHEPHADPADARRQPEAAAQPDKRPV